jgi:hypothetical protein
MAENYVLLETIELTQTAASVTFDNIPQTGYTDLKIVVSSRTSGTDSPVKIEFNGVTTGYSWRRIYGNGSSVSSLSGTDAYSLHVDTSSMTANAFSNSEIYIPNYTSSSQKSFSVDTALETNGTAGELFMLACLSTTTNAITSITLTHLNSTLVAGSTFSLYGIAAFGTTPVTAPKATGGNIVANDGTYWYHAFLTSGTFVPQTPLTCDYLVVAGGGGGGGYYHGAGGGAGGLRAIANQALTATSYNVVIGAGGAGGVVNGGAGTNGVASSFNSFATSGGGGGGSTRNDLVGFTGKAGGSGGGAPSYNSTLFGAGNTGSYSPVEGYAGGTAGNSGAPYYGSGGGGGAAAVGSNGSSSAGGAGGAGTDTYNSINFSTWLTATNTGSSNKLAGGGGGSAYSSGTIGAGGVGGGGNGANQVGGTENPVAGIANTGGGGGASERSGAGVGAAGGSGIVIIRYPIAS